MNLNTWYRRSESNVYHLAGPKWVEDDKALCGADLSRVSRTYIEDARVVSPPSEFFDKQRCECCATLRMEQEVTACQA